MITNIDFNQMIAEAQTATRERHAALIAELDAVLTNAAGMLAADRTPMTRNEARVLAN